MSESPAALQDSGAHFAAKTAAENAAELRLGDVGNSEPHTALGETPGGDASGVGRFIGDSSLSAALLDVHPGRPSDSPDAAEEHQPRSSATTEAVNVEDPKAEAGFIARRSARERKAAILMASGVAGLFAVQMAVVRPAIERKLLKRAQAVLVLDGSKAVAVTASGRDLSLAGYVATEDARVRVLALVKARRGVRVVDGAKLLVDAALAAQESLTLGNASATGIAGDPASPESPVSGVNAASPVRTGDGSGDQGAAESLPVANPAAQSATAAALDAERAKPMRRAKIVARISSGKVTIEGNVPSEEGRDQLLGRTRQNLGEQNVTDSLVLPGVSEERADLNDYRRVGQLLSIVSSFPGAEISLSYDRGSLQISGTVSSANDFALAQGEIRKLVPDDSLRDDRLSVGTVPAARSTSVGVP
jgi:osmotically-inducible protein OsmY